MADKTEQIFTEVIKLNTKVDQIIDTQKTHSEKIFGNGKPGILADVASIKQTIGSPEEFSEIKEKIHDHDVFVSSNRRVGWIVIKVIVVAFLSMVGGGLFWAIKFGVFDK